MSDLTTFLSTWADAERDLDAATTDRLLTDDFIGIGPVGFQLPKAAWLQRLTGGDLRYESLGLDEVTTREYGDCAITTARWNARGTSQGHPIPEATRATLVTVKQGGEWRLATVHFSFMMDPAAGPHAQGSS
jgi:ketosteroid isomerase-like protein